MAILKFLSLLILIKCKKQPDRAFFTARNEVAARVCFHRCL